MDDRTRQAMNERSFNETRLRRMEDRMLRPLTSDEMNELDAARARADSAAAHWGAKASQPLPGERPDDYRRRCLAPYLKYSEKAKGLTSDNIPSGILNLVETQVYADAIAAAKDPRNYKPGELRAVSERDASGRLITKYYGDNGAWMSQFMTGAQVCTIRDPRDRR
jgi:hypothetical protein